MRIVEAVTGAHVADARTLVEEYVTSIQVDLAFQNYQEEIASFPGEYARPAGVLLLAYERESPIGVVALRQLERGVCEMKRMYVRPSGRGRGVGRALSDRLIALAVGLGYVTMRLDTLSTMDAALGLYRSLGFREIPAYRYNPIPGARFLELDLRSVRR
jgi:putative acetyltransferase